MLFFAVVLAVPVLRLINIKTNNLLLNVKIIYSIRLSFERQIGSYLMHHKLLTQNVKIGEKRKQARKEGIDYICTVNC